MGWNRTKHRARETSKSSGKTGDQKYSQSHDERGDRHGRNSLDWDRGPCNAGRRGKRVSLSEGKETPNFIYSGIPQLVFSRTLRVAWGLLHVDTQFCTWCFSGTGFHSSTAGKRTPLPHLTVMLEIFAGGRCILLGDTVKILKLQKLQK